MGSSPDPFRVPPFPMDKLITKKDKIAVKNDVKNWAYMAKS